MLEDSYLITRRGDICELTAIGKIIVDEMAPLIGTLGVFEIDMEYWGTHNLCFIPSHLFKRMSELGSCSVITPSLAEMYEVNREFHKSTMGSKSLVVMILFFTRVFMQCTLN
jgi:predicted transcriptional regulator